MENVGYSPLSAQPVVEMIVHRWISLLSFSYTNEMIFAPLLTSAHDGSTAADAEVQGCSPRSMYSLTTAVRIFINLPFPVLTG